MNGDANRGDTLLQKLIGSDIFSATLAEARSVLGIPSEGFSEQKDVQSWYNSGVAGSEERNKTFEAALLKLQLPINVWWSQKIAEQIIANGQTFLPRTSEPRGPFVEIAGWDVSKKGSMVDLRLYEGLSRDELIEFVKKHWNSIKPSYRQGTAQKIRPPKSSATDAAVLKYWTWTKKDLGQEDGQNIPKEILVSRRMQEDLAIKVSPERVLAIMRKKKNAKR
ncbi:MAG: hypothetical protein V4644_01530 [Patescibacteria group bacterium]